MAGGALYAWGWNRNGQLGVGASAPGSSPVPILVRSVASGFRHLLMWAFAGKCYSQARTKEYTARYPKEYTLKIVGQILERCRGTVSKIFSNLLI